MEKRNLHEVAHLIDSGDLLLFRGRGPISKIIQWAGRSEYSHAAKADHWGDLVFCCEVREGVGGRAVTLASQVLKYPGQIDVFKTNPGGHADYRKIDAVRAMREFAGCHYGWVSVLQAAIVHLPHLIALLFNIKVDYGRESKKRPPFCSQACAWSDQKGGVDPVPNLANKLTLPGDLARSMFYEKRFTLIGV